MSIRECKYTASKGVKACLGEAEIDELVKRAIDKVYAQNLDLKEQDFTNRFIVPMFNGKCAKGGDILKQLAKDPKSLIPKPILVTVSEKKGEDFATVVLQEEVEAKPILREAFKSFIDMPCHFPWDDKQFLLEIQQRIREKQGKG